jgi:hypothetical protein
MSDGCIKGIRYRYCHICDFEFRETDMVSKDGMWVCQECNDDG